MRQPPRLTATWVILRDLARTLAKKEQIAGLKRIRDRLGRVELLVGVAGNGHPRQPVQQLGVTRAVDTERRAAAPQVGHAGETDRIGDDLRPASRRRPVGRSANDRSSAVGTQPASPGRRGVAGSPASVTCAQAPCTTAATAVPPRIRLTGGASADGAGRSRLTGSQTMCVGAGAVVSAR